MFKVPVLKAVEVRTDCCNCLLGWDYIPLNYILLTLKTLAQKSHCSLSEYVCLTGCDQDLRIIYFLLLHQKLNIRNLSFINESYKNNTGLSKEFWQIKMKNCAP